MDKLNEARQRKADLLKPLGNFPAELRTALIQPKALAVFRLSLGTDTYMQRLLAYKKILDDSNPDMNQPLTQIRDASVSLGIETFQPAATDKKASKRTAGAA